MDDGGKPDWTEWLLDCKAYEGRQRNSGSFWCGSGGDERIFLFWTEEGFSSKGRRERCVGMNSQFCWC